jgi:hypothetical protein
MSKRPAPVAIISMAQQASPNVIGHKADLRAQFTVCFTGATFNTGAATFRRNALKIASTVVKTIPSGCSAIFKLSAISRQLFSIVSLSKLKADG